MNQTFSAANEQLLPYESRSKKEALSGAFFWLTSFYLVYCLRPEDWVPGLRYIPMAKITGIFAIIGLLTSLGKTKRGFKDLPREATYLLAMMGLLFVGAFLSTVWRGGAVLHTIEFSKSYVAWVLTFMLITTIARLRRIVYIQAASVCVISAVAIIKGHSVPRLDSVLAGIYGNPNDLAFAIVLSIPFAFMFLITAKGILRKMLWIAGMLFMATALFLTASRAGFVTLVISGTVSLWHFGVKGKRPHIIVAAVLVVALVGGVAGGRLKQRFTAISGDVQSSVDQRAYGSYEERQYLMHRAVEGIIHYPLLGIGVHNFPTYSLKWKEVHVCYLQIAVEGGIPVLILYLLFFARGFRNLKALRRRKDLDENSILLVGALHSSLIGFVVGACFAPEAYQFFPYFAVAYTSVLFAIVQEKQTAEERPVEVSPNRRQFPEVYARGRSASFTPVG